ncbi:deleted in lung and esophageal cancer protein 1 isoform X2 [Syngnathoides biaculeatus]|uniref:deleted in lung and esophageal cancer protein 1 isoform X2 n=1 Tax=Syngnathoides biaculeatus TaxID=300417 RepID=UPI002ADE1A8E|nr:deleted in lung and esophageal cancer protein 1 isoform X2 [Syngnathoides biaculeatus]
MAVGATRCFVYLFLESVMLEEREEQKPSRCDLPVDSHTPASAKSQDISHVLASTFKELYTKVTPCNLMKAKGRSSYHDKYVEELKRVRAEYNQRIKEADMLESHIIQARARAAATERRTAERMKEDFKDVPDLQGLPPVKSAFIWHVDEGLLQVNNLISPLDYLKPQKIQMKAPAVVKPDLTRPTIAYTMHTATEAHDNARWRTRNESESSQTLECSSLALKNKKTPDEMQNRSRPMWKDEPSATDRAEGDEKLQKMKERQRVHQNPRFLPPKAHQGAASLIRPRSARTDHGRDSTETAESAKDNPVQVFVAKPPIVLFTVYNVGQVYETTLELQNVTFSSRDIRVLPPNTSYFTIGLGRFPGKGGVVAPGMSCKFTVRFGPDSLADYEDCIVVESQGEHTLVVPIEARRPPPVLTLPSVLDCGYCLIGGVRCVEFYCQNIGLSAGTFCIVSKNQWPATNPRLVVSNSYSEQPPFAVSPSFFALQPGETTVVEAVFFPTTTERICRLFTVVCDNCQVKDICVEGEGQLIALELLSVSGKEQPPVLGEVRDMTADYFIRFDPCNPHAVQQKTMVIRNNVHLELPFHWQVMKPNLMTLLPGELPELGNIQYHHDRGDIFQVSPATGILPPCQDREFTIAFCPKEMQDYHSVCHLVLSDVPQLPLESCEEGSGLLQPVRLGSKVGDATVMEIEVKGTTEPFNVLLEPYALIIPGELFIFTTTQRHFKMWNYSKTSVFFRWDAMSSSCHQIEVEPATGKIDQKECFVFQLMVTGGKPEKVVTSLLCHIEHCNEPVILAVEVTFKGPSVSISAPSVDFGLMRLGEQSQKTLHLDNVTHLEASWTLEEVHRSPDDGQDPQLIMEPSSGVLPPMGSCCVVLHFRPQFCQELETELELTVENGTGCHLLLRADVQSPQLCLLSCKLVLSELYMGVAAEGSVTLFNQTLLPSNFSWMPELKGQQASLCSASFEPSSGTLGPNARLDITVSFISRTDSALDDVVALCEVEGMSSPLVLSILAPTTQRLRVSYSLPGIDSPPPDDAGQPVLTVDFGVMLLAKPITKQLLMTNHTAIPAPFTVHAEYFNSDASKPSSQSKRRSQYMKKPLHSVQARKLEEQSHKDFLSNLLANGKGAAFFIVPSAGTLDPFETQTVDVTAYSDMWGEYRDNLVCKVGDLEPSLLPMQMTVKGCPLYFQITGPRPEDQHQGPNVQFGTRLSGGDTITRSLRINNPTLFDIRLDWETYNVVPNDRKLVDVVMSYGESFPLKDANGNPRGASSLSNGEAAWKRTQFLGSEASGRSSNVMDREDRSAKDDNGRLCPAKRKMLSVHIRPHVGDKSDEPYCVTPQQIVIPAQGSSTVHVSFTPLTLSATSGECKCMGLALGFISLDSEVASCVPGKVARVQGLDLEPIRVELLAVVKPAVLLVQMEDDNKVVEFYTSAGDLLRIDEDEVFLEEFDNVQSFLLKNTTEMPLRFRLRTQSPFSVLKVPARTGSSASSRSSAADPHVLVLHSQNSILVRVAFCCSPSLLEYVEHPTDCVTLVPCDGGYKQLKIQQDLLIHYSNNSLQMVPLCAHLKLASLCLSTDHINFGLCYVGQSQAKEVKLYSLGSRTHWSLRIESSEDNSHVFSVTPSSGLLRSKDHQSTGDHCQRLEISFIASEVKQYKSTVVITSILERNPLLLELQGTGSRQMYL